MNHPQPDRLRAAGPRILFDPRRVIVRPDIGDLIGHLIDRHEVDVLRPLDLLSLRFSFHNLRLVAQAGSPPLLVRRDDQRPAHLVVTFPSQHLTENAFFETAGGSGSKLAVKDPPAPFGLPPGATPPADPDKPPKGDEVPPPPPVFSSLSGPSRLVFTVSTEQIPYSVEGLLDAMTRLELAVAPQARPPSFPRRRRVVDTITDAPIAVALGAHKRGVAAAIALSRLHAVAAQLEPRFGTDAAHNAVAGLAVTRATDLGDRLGDLVIKPIPIDRTPPLPDHPPDPMVTALEMPWRLQISPNNRGAWAHSSEVVEHGGRVELWHSRLGVRDTNAKGAPIVDERAPDYRTVRAIWARDFTEVPGFGFTANPDSDDFPPATGNNDNPGWRKPLTSRDRMMLVHETANFHLTRQRRTWVPQAVPVNRLMLSTLGGWLNSRVFFETLPDGGLTIEEWKHIAGMGRDHEVKVVYAGLLLPFGHRASLVKVTERKIKAAGAPAYLYQRMFIIVREPEKQFRKDTRSSGDKRLDLTMPFSTVRILTTVTPDLNEPAQLSSAGSGMFFVPKVSGANFPFKVAAVDVEGNVVEFRTPLVFMERDWNVAPFLATAMTTYNNLGSDVRDMPLDGQRVAYAESTEPDDTALATASLTFVTDAPAFLGSRPQDEARFVPMLQKAQAVVPAMSALAGAATPVPLAYADQYAKGGFAGNAAEVFLKTLTPPALNFAGQGDRSGGFVTPSLNVSGLSRLTGPIGGKISDAVAGTFDPAQFFAGISAKLFGVVKLTELLDAVGFSPDTVPSFVAQTLDVASALAQNIERVRDAAQAQAGALGAAATDVQNAADTFLNDLQTLVGDPTTATPPDLGAALQAVADKVGAFKTAVQGATTIPAAQRDQTVAIVARIEDQLDDAAAVTAAAQALLAFARGFQLPEVLTARLDWSADLPAWPSAGSAAIFAPVGGTGRLTLAVEIQAPTRPGRDPSVLTTCSLTPFDLRLIGSSTFLILHFHRIRFAITPGKKPDVDVAFDPDSGIDFEGPLAFVDTLRSIIPFDGFSDPPYLDITSEGLTAGFDLAIPNLAVGVFALENIALGAKIVVPFLDESLLVGFNFCTRENPFRLSVSLFAGGGFFGITITPEDVRILEAALEFGAAIAVNFGVASGGISVMAGIYFKLESKDAVLSGYFRMRGEVDVLGLISASIELYLELTYETATKKAVGRATLTIEVEVLFLSFSVQISAEKKFAGANGDPSFADVMGLPPGAPPGTERPWDTYCAAFA